MAALTKAAGGNFVAPTPTTNELKFDYNKIEQEHRKATIAAAVEINVHIGRVNESVLIIGKRLSAIKDILPHGQFEAWVTAEFTFSIRTAQNFMNVFERFGHQPKVFDLFSPSGAYLLAAPSTPPEAVKVAIKEAKKLAKTGEKMSREAVKNIIKPAQKTAEIHEKSATVALLKPTEIDAEFTVIEQTQTPPTAPEAPQSAKPGATRAERLNVALSVFEAALRTLDAYGELTGCWPDVPPTQRALEKIIVNLKGNITK